MTNKHIISCFFETADALYQAYMPFLSGGGLFVKTNQHLELGDLVILKVTLVQKPTVYSMVGKVAWITPSKAQGNKPCGVGVQFIGDIAQDMCKTIEKILSDVAVNFNQTTDTM